MKAALGSALILAVAGCSTMGSVWVNQPLPSDDRNQGDALVAPEESAEEAPASPPKARSRSASLGSSEATAPALAAPAVQPTTLSDVPEPKAPGKPTREQLAGKVLGTFRNTYYDFPSESDFEGAPVDLKNAHCDTIKSVPKGFYEAVCVQGSGTLASGPTVSFAKRDCECAAVCPRTGQHICFDSLDPARYPWGRGSTGNPITPLLTVAVDSDLIPLGTSVYIPEYDGMPRDADSSSLHDGCFIAQDRGVRVKGQHIDVFTGHRSMTDLWNHLVPSNKGVTIVLDSPRCARAGDVSNVIDQSQPQPSQREPKSR